MGVDFGEKRIGLAITQGSVAVPLVTLIRKTDRISAAEISELAKERRVVRLIVGEPLGLDGRGGSAAERVRRFGSKLAKRSGLEVTYVNESLTSHEAKARLEQAGVDTRKRPEAIDAMSAAILLEQELDQQQKINQRDDPKDEDS